MTTLAAPVLHDDPVARLVELRDFLDRCTAAKREDQKNVRPRSTTTRRPRRATVARVEADIEAMPLDAIKANTWVGIRGVPGLFKVKRVNVKRSEVTTYGGVPGHESFKSCAASNVIAVDQAEIEAHLSRKQRDDDNTKPKRARKSAAKSFDPDEETTE